MKDIFSMTIFILLYILVGMIFWNIACYIGNSFHFIENLKKLIDLLRKQFIKVFVFLKTHL